MENRDHCAERMFAFGSANCPPGQPIVGAFCRFHCCERVPLCDGRNAESLTFHAEPFRLEADIICIRIDHGHCFRRFSRYAG